MNVFSFEPVENFNGKFIYNEFLEIWNCLRGLGQFFDYITLPAQNDRKILLSYMKNVSSKKSNKLFKLVDF